MNKIHFSIFSRSWHVFGFVPLVWDSRLHCDLLKKKLAAGGLRWVNRTFEALIILSGIIAFVSLIRLFAANNHSLHAFKKSTRFAIVKKKARC